MTESSNAGGESPPGVTEAEATRLAWQAVELAGGARMIYRNPRQPFSPNARKVFDLEGRQIDSGARLTATPAAPRCRRDDYGGDRPAPASPGSGGGSHPPASPVSRPR